MLKYINFVLTEPIFKHKPHLHLLCYGNEILYLVKVSLLLWNKLAHSQNNNNNIFKTILNSYLTFGQIRNLLGEWILPFNFR